jgi:hypothetical protein
MYIDGYISASHPTSCASHSSLSHGTQRIESFSFFFAEQCTKALFTKKYTHTFFFVYIAYTYRLFFSAVLLLGNQEGEKNQPRLC